MQMALNLFLIVAYLTIRKVVSICTHPSTYSKSSSSALKESEKYRQQRIIKKDELKLVGDVVAGLDQSDLGNPSSLHVLGESGTECSFKFFDAMDCLHNAINHRINQYSFYRLVEIS